MIKKLVNIIRWFFVAIAYFFLILFIIGGFGVAFENPDEPEYMYIAVGILVISVYATAYVFANVYMNSEKYKIYFANEDMNHSLMIKDYYEAQDDLEKRLAFVSRFYFLMNKKNQFDRSPKKMLKELREKEELRTNTMLDRVYRFYRKQIKEQGPSTYARLYEDEVNKFSDRFTADNRKHASVNVFMLKRYEQTVGKIEEADILDGSAFEEWCADLLTKHGFNSVNVTGKSGDQGVDITAEKGGVRYAIQCKRYSSDLDNTPVQEVYAGRMVYRCQVGVVMTNQHFTAGAKDLAENTGVLLWDRDKLIEMLETAQ